MVPMGRDGHWTTNGKGSLVVQMGRDGHSGLPMILDHWDTSIGSQHTPWYRLVGMDTLDYQWHGILGLRPWDPSIQKGTDW